MSKIWPISLRVHWSPRQRRRTEGSRPNPGAADMHAGIIRDANVNVKDDWITYARICVKRRSRISGTQNIGLNIV